MAVAPIKLREDYWETFEVGPADIEFLYQFLLEKEVPQTSQDLTSALVQKRIQQEKLEMEEQRSAEGAVFYPKDTYSGGEVLTFPALSWQQGKVQAVRPGQNPDLGSFQVIRVSLDNGEEREFAAGLAEHVLNTPPDMLQENQSLDLTIVMAEYGEQIQGTLEDELGNTPDFVRIAGKWFPRALLMDIGVGHLNLAEAVLDMLGGGPQSTIELMEQIGLTGKDNPKLAEFSFDLALQEDPRFDEVGPAGQVLWFLNRLEPQEVLNYHPMLRMPEQEYDRNALTPSMLDLERQLDDELSPFSVKSTGQAEAQVTLLLPHWRAGTLPLSARVRHLFPTAYETPRIRFMLVDGDTGEQFPGWVVRPFRYVFGLREWYQSKGVIPGSIIRIRRGKPGEVIVQCESRRPVREWLRTVLIGSDGGIVFAMLKQNIATAFDERMTVVVPDVAALDQIWQSPNRERQTLEKVVIHVAHELVKLNPQSHVHASELYTAVNTVRRCPPGPILAMLATHPKFAHVGDLHFRFEDSERT